MDATGAVILDQLKSFQAHDAVHIYADTDQGEAALHHTLGTGPGQAARGKHSHWGKWKTLSDAGFTYGSNVVDYDSTTWGPCMVRKDLNNDEVMFSGLLRSTATIASGAVILTAPVGYRPSRQLLFPNGTDSGSTQQYVRIDVATNGQFSLSTNIAGGIATGSFIASLATIRYSMVA